MFYQVCALYYLIKTRCNDAWNNADFRWGRTIQYNYIINPTNRSAVIIIDLTKLSDEQRAILSTCTRKMPVDGYSIVFLSASLEPEVGYKAFFTLQSHFYSEANTSGRERHQLFVSDACKVEDTFDSISDIGRTVGEKIVFSSDGLKPEEKDGDKFVFSESTSMKRYGNKIAFPLYGFEPKLKDGYKIAFLLDDFSFNSRLITSKTHSLIFEGQVFSQASLETLKTVLESAKNLQELSLLNVRFNEGPFLCDDEAFNRFVSLLFSAIEYCTNLRRFGLRKNRLTTSVIDQLCQLIKDCPHLTSLDLTDCTLCCEDPDKEIDKLVQATRKHGHNLTEIYVDRHLAQVFEKNKNSSTPASIQSTASQPTLTDLPLSPQSSAVDISAKRDEVSAEAMTQVGSPSLHAPNNGSSANASVSHLPTPGFTKSS